MKNIPEAEIIDRIRLDNPWWQNPHSISSRYQSLRPRAYFDHVKRLMLQREPRRALILMGPRRVGKTVMLHQATAAMIAAGTAPASIHYVNVEAPLYNGLSIERMIELGLRASGTGRESPSVFLFDEIQYLREWEVHLKTAVDTFDRIKFVASGSAAAALRLKSHESGAGRFTDFTLPPLTFYEYLDLLGIHGLVEESGSEEGRFESRDIDELNRRFIDYLNHGGYPEAIFSEAIQADPSRYVRSDIIDKVLLRDLPSLYGIHDVQELNSLFTTLAYNTGDEVSLEALAKNSGVVKNTLKRYIEYLEAAFLIKVVHRIDRSAKRFKRATSFKVYLTTPSMRSALLSPVTADDEAMGNLVETAIFAQWFHSPAHDLHYARWKDGEVDIVHLDKAFRPSWVVEVKWSDAFVEQPGRLTSLLSFLSQQNKPLPTVVTTRTIASKKQLGGRDVDFRPAAAYCYSLGHNIIKRLGSVLH